MRKSSISLLLVYFVAFFCSGGCNKGVTGTGSGSPRTEADFQRVLSWLPADTETLLVANGPFWMSTFQVAENYKNYEVSTHELEKHFEGLTLALLNSKNYVLEKHLEGKKVLLGVEGSRHFRTPAGLGELPYEGCAVAIFVDDLGSRRDAFMKDAALIALRMEEIEGQKVVEFQEQSESDIWTSFVAFPQNNVVLVATNRDFLQEMLVRMRGIGSGRAFPETLPEWQYVKTRAQFWGLRHFDRRQASVDPTSPFGGEKSANLPDEQAIGLTYEFDPNREKKASLTYLSGQKNEIRKIEERRFPSSSEPADTAALHIQYRELGSGVIQTTYDLDHSRPFGWFLFVFMGSLGHAIYV
ncbi:MAG: hypothetical protein WBB89_18950 [Candidatus Acidiferrum sp.]